jgi:thiosulfate/3-mercaptopyruvate sulfurtransferase
MDPKAGFELYKKDHIKGAYYADLDNHLSGPVLTHGGRHPLPSVNILSQFFGKCGVDNKKIVVAYDDESGVYASRLWWLLNYLGHSKVVVMQGGYTNYKEKGYAISNKMPESNLVTFFPNEQNAMFVCQNTLKEMIENDSITLIDAREERRYKGIIEPIDRKAGHIPTAINIPWQMNFQKPGQWLESEKLRNMYEKQTDEKRTAIVYCGSGVTACVNVLAMNEAGYKDVKLYPGSWSDWISYDDNPVATNE